ncbi:HAMP domain-containing sensor histidine kinase [Niallia taxi]|uniref:sensor histidine kinase n=1 Tax=Niallia taxi TaxID=2499688 RepID=UPI002E228D56|nr:HAMP domain-containing sensor histidine kinase [Niallia taxi]
MKKLWKALLHIGGFALIFVIIILASLLVFSFTSWLLTHYSWSISPVWKQVINTLLVILSVMLGITCISRIKGVQNRQRKFFSPMIYAFEQMAQGNFNIDLSFYGQQVQRNHPYHGIIESMQHMATELGEMEQMRQEFISNVSHEIQSPLTSIIGFAEALNNEDLTKKEKNHYLQIIKTESLRLSKLSENLLKLTSLESEKTPFEPKQYRLDRQIRRVILACEPQWTAKCIDTQIDLENISIHADEDLLEQVWINLIHNSIKFTPENGNIIVTLLKENDSAIVTIKDTGIGMTEAVQARIFERFYKADISRNRQNGGSGLGLSITKKILEMHKGKITVKSEINKGTAFTIKLPLQ